LFVLDTWLKITPGGFASLWLAERTRRHLPRALQGNPLRWMNDHSFVFGSIHGLTVGLFPAPSEFFLGHVIFLSISRQ
jgi:hypothetical protein